METYAIVHVVKQSKFVIRLGRNKIIDENKIRNRLIQKSNSGSEASKRLKYNPMHASLQHSGNKKYAFFSNGKKYLLFSMSRPD